MLATEHKICQSIYENRPQSSQKNFKHGFFDTDIICKGIFPGQMCLMTLALHYAGFPEKKTHLAVFEKSYALLNTSDLNHCNASDQKLLLVVVFLLLVQAEAHCDWLCLIGC